MLNFLFQIKQYYSALSYSEKIFADFALKNQAQMIQMSITEAAEFLGIAPSTVICACKKLGFSGFRDFKLSAASAPNNSLLSHWQDVPGVGTSDQIYCQVVQSNIALLNESLKCLSAEKLEQAAKLLCHARVIHIIGESTSALLAQEAYDYLIRLGLRCSYAPESQQRILQANCVDEKDAAILVSQSGVNQKILKIAHTLRERKCPIVGISNFAGTELSTLSDIYLAPLEAPSEMHENNFTLRIPILCVIEALFYAVRSSDPERCEGKLGYNMGLVHEDVFGKKL